MALALDGTPETGTATGASTIANGTAFSCSAGSIVVICVTAEWLTSVGAAGTVSGISGGGIAWAGKFGTTFQAVSPAGFPAYIRSEIWWGYTSGAQTSQTYTVTFTKPGGTNNFDDSSLVVFAVKGFLGTAYQTNPWDSNAANGTAATNSSNVAPTVNISTTSAATFVFGFFGSTNANGEVSTDVGSGYTFIANAINAGGTNNSTIAVEYQVFSTAQTTKAVNWATARDGWIQIAAALAQGSASPFIAPPNNPVLQAVKRASYW